jgi:signal transduction histidine kinase/ActR/RegA family two-component response regulator
MPERHPGERAWEPIDPHDAVEPPVFSPEPLPPGTDLSEWLIEYTSDAYLLTDARGVIRRASPAAGRLLGVPQTFLARKPLALFVSRADLAAFRWLVNHVGTARTVRSAQLRMRTRAGVEFTGKVTAQALASAAGDGLVWLLADASTRQRLDELTEVMQFAREQLHVERELRVAAEHRRRAAEAAAEVARRADVTLHPRDLLRVMAPMALDLCEAAGARIALRVAEAEGDWIAAGAGMLDMLPGSLAGRPLGLEALVWADRVPRRTGDARQDDRLAADERARAGDAGIVAQVTVPLVVPDRATGVVSVCATERDRFSAADEEVLVRVAEQAAIALGQALRYQEQRTARVAAERTLAEPTRGLLTPALFDACPLGLVLATGDRITAANPAFLGLVGRVPADLTAGRLSWRELVGPDVTGRLGEALDAALRGGDPRWVEMACRAPDGAARDVLVGIVGLRRAAPEWLGIVLDLSHERGAAAELADARHQAETANRAKDEFMAVLGHELRNPLAAIRNAAAVLEVKGATDEEAVRLLGIVARQARHATRLVDDLLDLSRVVTGKVRLQREPLDLRAVVEHALAELAQAGRTREHRIAVESELALVHADPARLEQIVANLLDNALKYTPPGGRIEVTVRREGDEAVLSVSDTGVGLTPEMRTRIFDPFAQERRVLDRAQGGLGLGLPLVRRLVRLHGGTVTASSPGPGQGSTFAVRLPLLPGGAAERPGEALTAPATSRRVLIVDDHEDARLTLRLLLEREGHTVEEAADGPSGLAAVLRGTSEVALVDLALPGLDGYELARRARAARGARPVCLVAVTGYGQPDDVDRALEAGFDGFLVKPVDLAALGAVLRDLPRRAASVKGPRKVSPGPRASGGPPGESASAATGA